MAHGKKETRLLFFCLAPFRSSGDAIREPRFVDAVTRAKKFPYETDDASFDDISRQEDEAGKEWMAVQHHS